MPCRMLVLLMAATGLVAAQDPPTIAGRLNYVSGPVSFEPAGVTDWVQANVNRPLTIGDQVYADQAARAEIEVPGTAFQLGPQTAFQFLNLDNRNIQARLSEGTLGVHVRGLERDQNLEIDTPNLAFSIDRPGEYRIDVNPDTYETRVTAWHGDGDVTSNAGEFRISSPREAVITGEDQPQYAIYSAPGYDDFDQWTLSQDRRQDREDRYVSPFVVGYQDLDDYGSWRQVPGYGEAWVPTHVSPDWAPYHDGHWDWIDPWGWTWVDDEPWGFAPFHYGRWAFAGGSWCWVPGPVAVAPVYAPALVAWVGFGGGAGGSLGFAGGPAVGWFPLAPRDVYVPAYHASPTYVDRINTTNTTVVNNTTITNVYTTYVRTGTVSATANSVNRAAPRALVAVPQNALASARPVRQVALKVSQNQIKAIRTVDPAPRVAPQVASVLGRSSGTRSVPRPPVTVINKPVVAKAAPPPPVAPFHERQTLLARNPGHPLQIQQQQLAHGTQAAVSQQRVKVVSKAPPISPRVSNTPPPHRAQAGPATAIQRPGGQPTIARPQQAAPQQAAPRPLEPPQVQQQHAPVPRNAAPNRPPELPPNRPQAHPQQSRPFEPPSAQRPPARVTPPAQQHPAVEPPRPAPTPQAHPQQTRPFEPPSAQRPPAHATPPAQQHPAAEPPRPAAPPAPQQRAVQQRHETPNPPAATRPESRPARPPEPQSHAAPPAQHQEARPPASPPTPPRSARAPEPQGHVAPPPQHQQAKPPAPPRSARNPAQEHKPPAHSNENKNTDGR